jgi:hypothetical protein
MRRRMFEMILTAAAGVLAVGLLVSGGVLMWGYNFADSTVHDQLASQEIYFPAKGSPMLATPEISTKLSKYVGTQVVDGAQAKVYADDFIGANLKLMAGGKTASQVTAAAQANPMNAQLQGQAQAMFQGETTRGMLLNAYFFWKMGQIALYLAIAAFVGAAVLIALTLVGTVRLRTSRGQSSGSGESMHRAPTGAAGPGDPAVV